METPESIRLSLQQGEWVTSLHFSDTFTSLSVQTQGSSSSSIIRAKPSSFRAPVWPLYSSYGIHNCGQGGETHGTDKKHPNAPVPR